jgi:predicted  nucleic acid-binding Zn-ribbon protein
LGKSQAGGDPYEEYDQLLKNFEKAQKEKDELLKELQRLRDNQELIKLKNSALGGEGQVAAAAEGQ